MIELTLTNGLALILTLLGVMFTVNGFRHAFWDETIVGGLLLIGAWWLL